MVSQPFGAETVDAERIERLAQRASPTVRRTSLGLALLATALAVAAVAADLTVRSGPAVVPAPRLLAGLAMLGAGAAAILTALDRRHRDLPRRSTALLLLTVSLALIFGGQALNYLLTARAVSPFEEWIEGIPLALGTPIWTVGMVLIAWPPGMTRREVVLAVLDTLVAAMGLLVLWLVIVLPNDHPDGQGFWNHAAAVIDPGAQFLAVIAVVITAAASRRAGSLPVGQLIMLQSSVLVYIGSDIAGDILTFADSTTIITWSILGYVAAVWLFRGFAVAAALASDGWGRVGLRDLWTFALPYAPVPLAAAGVAYARIRYGPMPAGVTLLAAAATLLTVSLTVLLRIMVWRDMRRLQTAGLPSSERSAGNPAWFEAVLGDSRELITVVDRDGAIVYQTPAVQSLVGQPTGALVGKHIADLFPEQSRARFAELLLRASHSGADRGPHDMTLLDARGRRHDTESVITPLRATGSDGYVLTTRDVSDRRRLRAALADSSTRDLLTGLANREGFLTRVREVIPVAPVGSVAVALFDLDSFRDLNDSRGHAVGDQVLRAVAAVVEGLPDTVAAVGRTGPDEFGLIVLADPIETELGTLERTLRDGLHGVLLSDGEVMNVSFVLGWAGKHELSATATDLFEQADLAVSAARSQRSGAAVTFRPEMRSALVSRLRAEADLRDALDGDRLVVHYQPVVDLRTGALHSVEALARLLTTGGDLVGPVAFIERAEELGLIGRLGQRVLTTALRDSRRLASVANRDVPVAVNVSALQLDPEFPDLVAEALAGADVPAQRLILELTESVLAEGHETSGAILQRVRALGCQVALDDFGTGFSSLSYLARLPVDLMKIDKSFIGRLGTSGEAFALVRTLLQLAQTLGLATVAEGVETVEQSDILRGMDCARAQGFLYARPMPLSEVCDLIRLSGGALPLHGYPR